MKTNDARPVTPALAKHFAEMTSSEIASALRVYIVAADMYGLPTYLVALLNEVSMRIYNQLEEQP